MNNYCVKVFLGLGSNSDCISNINSALMELETQFGPLLKSPVYSSPPMRNLGADYLNLVVAFNTDKSIADLSKHLKSIEANLGRERSRSISKGKTSDNLGNVVNSPAGKVTIDLDILIYADLVGEFEGLTLPHGDILICPHVLRPLSELVPRLVHPIENLTMSELWQQYSLQNHSQLVAVSLS